MKLPLLVVAAAAIIGTSDASARTFTYQLAGSTLENCTLEVLAPYFPARPCTAEEREIYKPPDGHTVDGRIRIDENLLKNSGAGAGYTLVNARIDFIDITHDPAFEFDLANLGAGAEDYLILYTDAHRNPLSWDFSLNANATIYGDPNLLPPEGSFSGPNGIASYGKVVDPSTLTVRWSGAGGQLALVPLPAAASLLLAGLAALGAVGLGRRRAA